MKNMRIFLKVLLAVMMSVVLHQSSFGQISVTVSPATDTICQGDSVALSANVVNCPTCTVAWSPLDGTLSCDTCFITVVKPLLTTTYIATLIDSANNPITGQIYSAIVVINPNPALFITGNGFGPGVACDSTDSVTFYFSYDTTGTSVSSYELKVNGSTFYNSSSPPDSVSKKFPIGVDTVQFTIVGTNGCTSSLDYYIQNIKDPFVTVTSPGNDGCTPHQVCFPITSNDTNGSLTIYNFLFGDGTGLSLPHDSLPSVLCHFYTSTSCGMNGDQYTFSIDAVNACGSTFGAGGGIEVWSAPVANFPPPAGVCINQPVSFSNNSQMGFDINCMNTDMFRWEFGDGNSTTTSSSGNVPHTYTAPGNYTITLKAWNATCDTTYHTETICVEGIPQALFTLSDTTGCVPLTVNTNNTSLVPTFCGAAAYLWDFGNGTTDTSFNSSATFTTAGTYTVILTATNGCASDVQTVTVDVFDVPTVSLNPLGPNYCDSVTVQPLATFGTGGTTLSSVAWSFPSGTPANTTGQIAPSVFYGTAGTYTVSVTVNNSCGSATDSDTFSVSNSPNLTTTVVPPIICLGDMAVLTASGAPTILWSTNQMTPSISVSPTVTTAYTVTVTDPLGCTDTAQVTVNVTPLPTISLGGDTTVCVSLNPFPMVPATPTGGTWTGLGIIDSVLGTFDPGFAGVGVHTITYGYLDTLTGCFNSNSLNITVENPPVANFTVANLCLGDITQFTWTGTGNITQFNWDFGDSTSSTQMDPSHLYTSTGTKNVTLVVQDANGCFDTLITPVTITVTPVANFGSSTDSVCQYVPLAFTDNSLNGPDTWLWDFGDGGTSSLQNPTHSYATPGTYTVTLTASINSSGCFDADTHIIEVVPVPVPTFQTDSVCLDDAMTFVNTTDTNNSWTPYTWHWSFGDTNTSTQEIPTHVYDSSGTFNVTLIATNSFGCTDSISDSVVVHPLPDPAFTFNDTICNGNTVFFAASDTSAIAWNWQIDTGTATVQNPNYLFPDSGSYTVQLVLFNGFGCADSLTDTVVVRPNPMAQFATTPVCCGDTTPFSNNTVTSIGAPFTWVWDFGDGSTSALSNPMHPYLQGNCTEHYNSVFDTATLTAINVWGCFNSDTNSIEIYPKPLAGFNFDITCADSVTTFTDTTLGVPVMWTWTYGDGAGATGFPTVMHDYSAGGNYPVVLVVENAQGCKDTANTSVQVYDLPNPFFTATKECDNDPVSFTNLSGPLSLISGYHWDFGDFNGTSPVTNPFYTYATFGSYPVTLTAITTDGCDSSFTDSVTVVEVPLVSFSFDTVCPGQPTTFTNSTSFSTGPITWNWSFGDGTPNDSIQNVVHTYDSVGLYNVSLAATIDSLCADTFDLALPVQAALTVDFTFSDTICNTDLVTFTNLSNALSGTLTSYQWDFDDGSFSTQVNPQHTFANTGTYDVQLIVTNNEGCQDSITLAVTVSAKPQADFGVGAVCFGNNSQFTDLTVSVDPIISYNWNFGDSSIGAFPPPINKNYGLPGTYNVTLVVSTGAGCLDTVIHPAVVNPIPIPGFTSSVVCTGDSTLFTDTSSIAWGSIDAWLWDLEPGAQDTVGPITQYPFDSAGSYIVKLTVTSDAGCAHDTIQVVNVFQGVFADFAFSDPRCEGLPIQFSDDSSPDSNLFVHYWEFPGETRNDSNETVTFAAGGVYDILYAVRNGENCIDTVVKPVSIGSFPQPQFTQSEFCEGNPVTFYDNSLALLNGNVTEQYWVLTPGDTITGDSIATTFPNFGDFQLYHYLNTNFGCDSGRLETITIHPNPIAQFQAQDSCFDKLLVDNSTVPNGGTIAQRLWDLEEDRFIPGNQDSVYHQYNGSNSSFQAQLTVISIQGCSDTARQMLTTQPRLLLNDLDTFTICARDTVSLFATSTFAAPITDWTWQWLPNSENIDTVNCQWPNCNFVIDNTSRSIQNYWLQLNVVAGNCPHSVHLSDSIQVKPRPVADFSYKRAGEGDNTYQFKDETEGEHTRLWRAIELGDTIETNTNSVWSTTFINLWEQKVQLLVTNEFGCVDSTQDFINQDEGACIVYIPNTFTPNGDGINDDFYVKGDNIRDCQLQIWDRWGGLIWETTDCFGKWNGVTSKGVAQMGVYVVYFKYDCGNVENRDTISKLNLVRTNR